MMQIYIWINGCRCQLPAARNSVDHGLLCTLNDAYAMRAKPMPFIAFAFNKSRSVSHWQSNNEMARLLCTHQKPIKISMVDLLSLLLHQQTTRQCTIRSAIDVAFQTEGEKLDLFDQYFHRNDAVVERSVRWGVWHFTELWHRFKYYIVKIIPILRKIVIYL